MPSATSLARTSAASSSLPKREALVNLRIRLGSAPAVQLRAQTRTGLAGREQFQALETTGDCLVWAWEIRAQMASASTAFLVSGLVCTIRCTVEGAAVKCAECPKCHTRYVYKQDSRWIGKRPALGGNEHRLF